MSRLCLKGHSFSCAVQRRRIRALAPEVIRFVAKRDGFLDGRATWNSELSQWLKPSFEKILYGTAEGGPLQNKAHLETPKKGWT